ncbi:hypothetical protein [Methylobacterium oxalidis]|uniref:Uncharacterized protein n=1 Tax=Methylobacterium oxalidis TaxID=944322 RepID=A0A512J143_9HYPH|nr:hypothetical protein [Methylobacterium oxalidis]GEP03623.1 hypothetical protein MOX02_16610 [Methylobacterium oxalidis]GJE34330.1 hypothetical protein LDDCCGHA_4541 [Methylobacterium oxalidis]GLS64950.1 hypothetical protein GCM10007888_33310 [Methylobacterium oxalidis]
MTLRSETPPPPADLKAPATPRSERPTTAQLKADIDSGRTGDKVEHYDPGLSQLGTDDEAAGRPNGPDRIAAARQQEAAAPHVRAAADPQGARPWVLPAFAGFIVLAAVAVGLALWLLR